MHNLTKIRIFRVLLWITYPISIILIYPLVLLKKKKSSSLFFLFDRYAIGGAQRVYIDILESVKEQDKTIYFTRKSPNSHLKNDFFLFPNSRSYDIHIWCDYLLIRLFSVHYFSFYLNRHKNIVILSSNSTFFYDLLPFLKKSIKKIELLHNFAFNKNGMEYFGLANHQYLDRRMVIDEITRRNILDQYQSYNVNSIYDNRVKTVEYGVNLPSAMPAKPGTPPIRILYAGRGAAQKRVWLLNRIAEHFVSDTQIEFSFAGPLTNELSERVKKRFNVTGEIGDRDKLEELFQTHHIVILTSAFEGFPVVVKEGMSYGCVPVVTALPGNMIHLRHMENSILMEKPENEEAVVQQGIQCIQLLLNNRKLLIQLSSNAYEYAREHFGKDKFLETYHRLLTETGG